MLNQGRIAWIAVGLLLFGLLLASIPILVIEARESQRSVATARLAAAEQALKTHSLEPCDQSTSTFRADMLRLLGVDDPSVRFGAIVMPAFEAEYAIAAVDSDRGPLLRSARMSTSYWSAVAGPRLLDDVKSMVDPPPIERSMRQLRRAHFDRMALEWDASVAETRVNQDLGFDGVTYLFITPAGCGKAWTPRSDTRPGQLADIVEALYRASDDDQIGTMLDGLMVQPPSPEDFLDAGVSPH